jgi:PUA domain protein
LKEKEAKKLLKSFCGKLKVDLGRSFKFDQSVEVVETEFTKIFIVDSKPLFAKSENLFFPTLLFHELLQKLPRAIVDEGAIPHICGGADVMAPGVVNLKGDFEQADLVTVVDERYGKVLAIGVALLNSRDAGNLKHGKIFKNIHYVGDELWNLIKNI